MNRDTGTLSIAPAAGSGVRQLAAGSEVPEAARCVKLARASFAAGDVQAAYRWLARAAESPGPYVAWATAAAALASFEAQAPPSARRSARAVLAGSYTTAQLGGLLRLAALRRGVYLQLYETAFDAYTQEILNPASSLYEFDPDYVILAPHQGAVRFPAFAEDVKGLLEAEVARWEALWQAVRKHSRARVIQHTIAIGSDTAWGHLSARTPGSRDEMLRALNTRLAAAAGENVLLVDCDRVAGAFGKRRWFDDRYWHFSKQAVALDALPDLARHTAAVLAAAEGLSSKCIVLDLDNTLWGGVVAEDGLSGIQLGDGPQGEAYVAFQDYLLALRSRGILLAVISKNDDSEAREPFERHPDMRLRLSDMTIFIANWDDKATNLRRVAKALNLGLDSLVFVDDNPAERQLVRELLPEVEVVPLPAEPSGYVRALSESLLFESASLTKEDLGRAEQYQARAAAEAFQEEAGSLDQFYANLSMEATIAPFDELNLPRIAQLIGKTNQFNLTSRRHGMPDLRAFMADDRYLTLYLRLSDRFGDHGLVAVIIAQQNGRLLDIDTWLMSCRVLGRTVENSMFARLCEAALARGCTQVTGTFIPTSKNVSVRDLFARLGFLLTGLDEEGSSSWTYDINEKGVPTNEYIRTAPRPVVSHA